MSTRPCKTNTLLVTVVLDSATASADKLTISVSVAGAAPTSTPLDHATGQSTGTVEIDFPGGYPQGQTVTVGVVASRNGATIGNGSGARLLGGACEAITVTVTGGASDGGGSGGSLGTGGGVGSGGSDGGLGSGGSGGSDGGLGSGGVIATGGSDGGLGSGGAVGTGGSGAGGQAGAGAGGSGAGGSGCPTGQTTCGGVCFKTPTDRSHCGTACVTCAATEVCNSACTVAIAPAFVRVPPDPAGWLDPSGAALTLTVRDTTYPGAIYECRTGPDVTFTATTPAWTNCDGGSGTGRTHTPTPNLTIPEGNYRTEHRYRADTYTSPVVATRYYVHHSLDKVATCPRAGTAADGPHHADADYFAVAQAYGVANPLLFPVTTTFPATAPIPARTDTIYLRNPFIKIPFTAVVQSGGMYADAGGGFANSWPSTGGSYLFNERSLRHAWVMNAARTMILMKRSYVHPAIHCREEIWVGDIVHGTDYARHKVACEALVLNTHGHGLCLTTGGAVPIPVAIEAPPNSVGTVTATLNSTTITGSGTNFIGKANQFIQIPSGLGRWYRIAASPVPTATVITITPAYADTPGSGLLQRTSAAVTYNLPTGFARMHADAHTYATGVKSPGTPSPMTKCETLGCNAGRPWITYLPP